MVQVQLDCRVAVGLLASLEQVVLQALLGQVVAQVLQVRLDQLAPQEHLEHKVQREFRVLQEDQVHPALQDLREALDKLVLLDLQEVLELPVQLAIQVHQEAREPRDQTELVEQQEPQGHKVPWVRLVQLVVQDFLVHKVPLVRVVELDLRVVQDQ